MPSHRHRNQAAATVAPAFALVASGFAAGSASAAVVGAVAGFDADAQGFIGSTTDTVQTYLPNNGNPGGHLILRKILDDTGFDIGTTTQTNPDFVGDYAAAGITGAGFDLITTDFDIDDLRLRARRSAGENGWFYSFGAVDSSTAWESFDVAFDPTWDDATALGMGWTQEDPAISFADVFADVNWLEVRIVSEGSTIVGVDNIRLVPTPGPLALALLGAGVLARRRR
jgi:hypothetical protein